MDLSKVDRNLAEIICWSEILEHYPEAHNHTGALRYAIQKYVSPRFKYSGFHWRERKDLNHWQ